VYVTPLDFSKDLLVFTKISINILPTEDTLTTKISISYIIDNKMTDTQTCQPKNDTNK